MMDALTAPLGLLERQSGRSMLEQARNSTCCQSIHFCYQRETRIVRYNGFYSQRIAQNAMHTLDTPC
jgi:hypothetical protein